MVELDVTVVPGIEIYAAPSTMPIKPPELFPDAFTVSVVFSIPNVFVSAFVLYVPHIPPRLEPPDSLTLNTSLPEALPLKVNDAPLFSSAPKTPPVAPVLETVIPLAMLYVLARANVSLAMLFL